MNKKKNIILQCLATITIFTGLYAFKKIDKVKAGIGVYVLSCIAFLIINLMPFIYSGIILGDINKVNQPEMEIAIFISVTLSYIVTILIPIIFIYKWTKEYNKKILV